MYIWKDELKVIRPALHFLRASLLPLLTLRHTWTIPNPPEPSWDRHSQSSSGSVILDLQLRQYE